MKKTNFLLSAIVCLFLLNSCESSKEMEKNEQANTQTTKPAFETLVEAYLYGYPMLTMGYTHKVSTNVEEPNGLGKAPLNQWANMTKFPKYGFTAVVRPNLDTYYSLVYADVSKEPLYIEIPATERYYLIPILNNFGDVEESLGSRTTGQEMVKFVLAGPNTETKFPEDMKVIRSSTSLNWVLGRVAVKNDEDGKEEVENFQKKLVCVPYSEKDNPDYVAPKGTINPDYALVPMDKVDGLSIEDYFNEMMTLMVNNPPREEDVPFMEQFLNVGITPGGKFDISAYTPVQQEKIKSIPAMVQKKFAEMTAKPMSENMQNGWNVITKGLGEYGTNYALRAYVTKIGYGANTAEDAIYPNTAVDMDGNSYNGSNKYVLHFDADKLPPVKGFWSLTMYDKKGFLVDNEIDRYVLGSQKELTYNEDGSLDIYIQAKAPEGKESNWLPSTQAGEEFELTFRMYYPEETIINRSWQMPGVQKVD